MTERFDPHGRRLPIKLDTTSNGEFLPRPLPHSVQLAKELAHERAAETARRLGMSRRAFLKSLSGAALTLMAMNETNARAGLRGGYFNVGREAPYEPEAARETLAGQEFIFDIQCHHVNPKGTWRRITNQWTYILRAFPQSDCGDGAIECFSAEHFIREVFLDSDTDMAVLSAVPAAPEDNPLSTADAAATRKLVETLGEKQHRGGHRLLIHGLVHPNLPGAIEGMARQKEEHGVSAWKTYTQWGPEGVGYRLDDPKIGIPFIERARELGIKVICIHKGIPLFNLDYDYSTCRDIGVVARRYPDVSFIVYHSGFEPDRREGPYDPAQAQGGVDSLIKSLQDNEVSPNGNVYAEFGTTWRRLMAEPEQAAHVLGKLFKHVGENNVLWGTDSIWYGSPQDQIQAFRAFQIAEAYRAKYGYPEITPALRAKVFGLNAALPYRVPQEAQRKRAPETPSARSRQVMHKTPSRASRPRGPGPARSFCAFTGCPGADREAREGILNLDQLALGDLA
ncbi:MAG: amidohydrolase family protein [Gammaproteobacteria bacterium]